jgi:tRNA-2-methylthio-N6-dimethylallyladenosine synthase
MAQNYKEKIFERAPAVDFVVGPSDIHRIPKIIKELSVVSCQLSDKEKKGTVPFGDSPFFTRKIWETDGEIRPVEIYHTGFYAEEKNAYVVISEGCSNFCSYCVVPYVRGPLRNRNYEDILQEIEEAVDRGITKFTLLGQNVNAYQATGHRPQATGRKPQAARSLEPAAWSPQRDKVDFVKLLEKANGIKGVKEFSFITSHPKDTSLDLFKAMAELDKLKKYLHLPVQSGSDRILSLMNRGYTRKYYLDLAKNYRKIVQNGMLTSDIIVGFPTEKEEDFQDTYNLIEEIRFDAAYIFKYSPRPHTEAEKLNDDVEKKEKERRHRIILDLQKDISRKKKC